MPIVSIVRLSCPIISLEECLFWLVYDVYGIPEVRKYQQMFTVAMVTVKVGIAKSDSQLFELCVLHVLGCEVVQLRAEVDGVLRLTGAPLNYLPTVVRLVLECKQHSF